MNGRTTPFPARNPLTAPLPVVRDLPRKRLQVDPQWRCQRSGDCCIKPAEVVMKAEELDAIRVHMLTRPELHGIEVRLRHLEDGLVGMQAGPCPFFVLKSCVVYEVRPFNCRRFGCMRPDPAAEPFEADSTTPLGCRNLANRLAVSAAARKLAKWMQKRAQAWALAHGWSEKDA